MKIHFNFLLIVMITSSTTSHSGEFPFSLTDKIDLLTENDAALLEDMIIMTLDNQPDGYVTNWGNPVSGANGTLKLVATDQNQDYCRELLVVHQAKGYVEQTSLKYCRDSNNIWSAR